MTQLDIRIEGHAGRITLTRPDALNALTHDMCLALEGVIDDWRHDDRVALVVIDGAGEKAFCAGGDIQDMYASGLRGDYSYGQKFWRDEYRLNAKLFNYPKPIVTFLQGFTMGGGVGVGCHGSHRIVCETSQIAMPEVSIGLVPDVGGSLILARAPGFVGEYLGLTADRMDAADAIYAGFADHYVPKDRWAKLIKALAEQGTVACITPQKVATAPARLAGWQTQIDKTFNGATFGDIIQAIQDDPTTPLAEPLARAAKSMARHSPVALCATVGLIRAARAANTIEAALDHEYRFTSRSMDKGDFIEGIRAAIIDRDRTPNWRHDSWRDVTDADLAAFTAPPQTPLDLTGDRA